jgi:hypothetical protein
MKTTLACMLSFVLLILLSCNDKAASPLAPYQPEIANVADNFQFQATAMKNVSYSRDFSWQCSSDTVTVNQSVSAGTTGTMSLEILDSAGVQVYLSDLTANGTFGSTQRAAAVPGAWKIRVQFTRVTGIVNFRVQKSS